MNIETVIAEVRDLPPTPQILPKLQKILRDPEAGLDDVVDLVKVDPALTAQIVRLSNSGWYGGSTPSENINDAINRVGFQEVYKLVSLVTSNQVLGIAAPIYHMAKGELFERSIGAALLMERIGQMQRLDKDATYTAGLLHGIGKVVINSYCLERGLEIYSQDDDADELDPQMERMVLGFVHTEVAGTILRRWGFSDAIAEAIEYHPEPLNAPNFTHEASLLHLASWISYNKYLDQNIPISKSPNQEVLEQAGLTVEILQDCVEETRESVQALQSIFRKKS
ncbi:MAG: HDOD domain-containing protein [Opitutales bacterium]